MTYAQMLFYEEAIHQLAGLLKDNGKPAKSRKLSGKAKEVLFAKAGNNGNH